MKLEHSRDRQYSINLGKKTGIDLVTIPDSLVGNKAGRKENKVYDNCPYNPHKMKKQPQRIHQKGGALDALSIAGLNSCQTSPAVTEEKKVTYLKDRSALASQEPLLRLPISLPVEPTDDDLSFIKQMGVVYVVYGPMQKSRL
jgi:hypothetical protein